MGRPGTNGREVAMGQGRGTRASLSKAEGRGCLEWDPQKRNLRVGQFRLMTGSRARPWQWVARLSRSQDRFESHEPESSLIGAEP